MKNKRVFHGSLPIKDIYIAPITQEQLIQYAGASTDFNPIHTIERKAIEFGLPGVIAHGMLTMAFMGKGFSPFVEKGAFIEDFHARFKTKVFVGDSLIICTEQVQPFAEHVEEDLFHYTITVFDQNQKEVANGLASLNVSWMEENVKVN